MPARTSAQLIMEYPLIGKELLADLRLVHGIYNLSVFLLFLYQGRLGLKIRRARRAKAPLPFPAIKRHRSAGPVLAGLALFGYASGIVLVLLHTGKLLEYPPHLLAGSLVIVTLSVAVLLSRRIKGQDSSYRSRHTAAALILIVLFFAQVLLGIGVLF